MRFSQSGGVEPRPYALPVAFHDLFLLSYEYGQTTHRSFPATTKGRIAERSWTVPYAFCWKMHVFTERHAGRSLRKMRKFQGKNGAEAI